MTLPSAAPNEIGFDLPEQYNAARLLWDNLPERADNPAIFHDNGVVTYGELAAEAARIGNHLSRFCAPGDRVLLFLDDEPSYPAAIMGAMRAGLVPMLINTLSPPELLAFYLEDSAAKAIVSGAEYAAHFADATVPVIIVSDRPWAAEAPTLNEHQTARGDMAFWMYSSGSTGKPKGVVHRHEDAAFTAHSYARHVLDIGPGDICFSVPKIFFAYGFGNSVTFPMSVGAAAVLLTGRPTPERVLSCLARYRPTIFFALPTVYTMLQKHGLDGADMSSVRLFVSAAEILSNDLSEDWIARFGKPIVEGLGSTEMLHIYLSNTEAQRRPGSAGRVVPGYGVRLVLPDGTEAADGQEGVMQVAGVSGAKYYWNRPEKTAETMCDGWIDTGDRFARDADGFYYFKGRADDLVKVSGQWVYPLEIELALNEHPSVVEACVQAVELPDRRMTLKAWVTPRGVAGPALKDELQAHAKRMLLPHKYPREIVFLDALPKTGTDKIDRQRLRTMDATE